MKVSRNGLYMILAGLCLWFMTPNIDTTALDSTIEDINWVLEQMFAKIYTASLTVKKSGKRRVGPASLRSTPAKK